MMNNSSILQTPVTHDINASLDFYKRLGFEQVNHDNLTLFTDGKVLISINSERTARTALQLFGDWEDCVEKMKSITHVEQTDDSYQMSDPNGVQVFLQPSCTFEISGSPSSVLGNFAGLSIETTDFGRTLTFWETLGYKQNCGNAAQGWVTMEQDGFAGISIMKTGACPHLFYSPGLTYFNSGNNLENIAKIKEAGIEVTEEISCFNKDGVVDNVIVRDPGGTGFFIFND